MDSFPKTFTPDYKKSEDLYELNLRKLRKKIYKFILKGKEEDFYDLCVFENKRVGNWSDVTRMLITIRQELEELGWKTKLVFGETGLMVYSGEGNAATWGAEF